MFTEKGSRFFRALVELNPKVTSDLLYRLLSELSNEQIKDIDGSIRRNLVWALEKLCFHASEFEKSTLSLLALATAENERWNNNATSNFVRLFRVLSSDTGATPEQRFDVLRQAIERNDEVTDLLVIKALEQAISNNGGVRIIGAEYQGTQAALQAWSPLIWDDVFNYWEKSFELLFQLFERGASQRTLIIDVVGNAIRGLFNHGRIKLLDTAIREIVIKNGRYWPTALNSLKLIAEYDLEHADPPAKAALDEWLALLSPVHNNLPELLKIVVIDPPWEHKINDDGDYTDVSEENAKNLATKLAGEIDTLLPQLGLLLIGEQKQSYIFGMQLIESLEDYSELYSKTLTELYLIENPNISFFLGILEAIYKKSISSWKEKISELRTDKKLMKFLPNFLKTGEISEELLSNLLVSVESNEIDDFRLWNLGSGHFLDKLNPNVVIHFCSQLSKKDAICAWIAIDITYMYIHSHKEHLPIIRDELIQIITGAPLVKNDFSSRLGVFHWKALVETLLNEKDEVFAKLVASQFIRNCKYGFEYSDVWHALKPTLLKIIEEYGNSVWPLFSAAIDEAEDMEMYWLRQLLERENGSVHRQPSALNFIDSDLIINWCKKNPAKNPYIVATCIDVLISKENKIQPNPLLIRLLENFGENLEIWDALSGNLASRSWSGSLVPYLESDKSALTPLLTHDSQCVKKWVKSQITEINRRIGYETERDQEQDFRAH